MSSRPCPYSRLAGGLASPSPSTITINDPPHSSRPEVNRKMRPFAYKGLLLTVCLFQGSLALAEDSSDSSQLLTPRTPRRRRSSVMFSSVVVEHGLSNSAADVNVCWNEKTSQTGQASGFNCELVVCSPGGITHPPAGSSNPSSPLSLNRKSSLKQRNTSIADEQRLPGPALMAGGVTTMTTTTTSPQVPNGAGLTCQELLALSGALGAALPTPLALPNYPSVEELPTPQSSTAAAAMAVTPTASSKHGNNNKCNSQLLAPPGMMPILPTLAMSLWPEPFQGKSKEFFFVFFFYPILR